MEGNNFIRQFILQTANINIHGHFGEGKTKHERSPGGNLFLSV